ncbi:uncharacterized protein LOC124799763 isoform X2 [Schistocerca piceifrons]|uniref:uncharacterized protein LOC124799763 isoform X2 n=1 Tax=Schistocerca piceifrons TaxID=274613 RepID=UPI001F5EBC30|nr:uncharacterized protein LOC124799763 isoform X2 [Schistocerca piceifrons]
MTDFHLSRCYEPRISATKNRKMSRSDLAFQKLKKYEVKYKTNRNLTSVLTNSESVEANSESHIEQYKSVIPVYTGPRDRQQDLTTYFEASEHCLQKAEETGGRASLKNGPIKKDPDPAVSFLDKSLMEQVNITQYLINSHHTVYNAYCTAVRNLSKNYQPVTLENTMQFIKHSKKKKRKKMASP